MLRTFHLFDNEAIPHPGYWAVMDLGVNEKPLADVLEVSAKLASILNLTETTGHWDIIAKPTMSAKEYDRIKTSILPRMRAANQHDEKINDLAELITANGVQSVSYTIYKVRTVSIIVFDMNILDS